jgi:predicted membrane-bound mannosyltransferase/DNA-binding beta-propeller fold protein YncE
MQSTKAISSEERSSWLDRPLIQSIPLSRDALLLAIILVAAIFTRFYDLEPRVMSHDETSHVYFSWLLNQGRGYLHDPITHGPLQFHLIALSYFLFGDSDISARIPVVLFSIATIGFIWFYRRYLGRAGALIGMALFTISPYMLYYGRYVRNESYVAFAGVVTIWAILRYFETGRPRFIYFLTAATILHYIAKETAYIYSAQVLLFLAFYFVYRLLQNPWPVPERRNYFLGALAAFLVLASGAALVWATGRSPVGTDVEAGSLAAGSPLSPFVIILGALAAAALAAATFFTIQGYTWPLIRRERVFDLLIIQGTLTLPLLTAFPLALLGWNVPVNASQVSALTALDMVRMGGMLLAMFILATAIGLWWQARLWLSNAALFYSVFVVFYTTIFTNGAGLFTGILGGLGYWITQQEVQRGGQPWYYYIFLQIPVYEYLAALGCLLAIALVIAGRQLGKITPSPEPPQDSSKDGNEPEASRIEQPPVFSFLGFWIVTSILAFSYAGEKMPWLTVHIALGMLLLTALALGHLVERTDWAAFMRRRGILVVTLLPVFAAALVVAIGSWLSPTPPFQGRELVQLQATSTFLTAALAAVVSAWALFRLLRDWEAAAVGRVFILTFFGLLGILTFRTAAMASYINYDNATEYLVYAHSGPGNKVALEQIKELSRRTTDGLGMQIAYDDATTYPFWWYLRNFTNQRYFGDSPSRDLRDAPAILVGDRNYHKMEPIVGQAYYSFEYIRIWWPNQDYFNLTWERILNAVRDPQMRTAIFQIWFNRDYTLYGQLTNRDMSLPRWEPAERMRLYLRKDLTAQLWEYGTVPQPEDIVADPYEERHVNLGAERIIGGPGLEPGSFTSPRNVAVGPDGSIYVADSGNHRIQRFSPDGILLNEWGSFSGPQTVDPGTFNEPWGIAVGPHGSVYVTDTWNHRIQKFSAEGQFLTAWGIFGQAETPVSFWGPRGLAVNPQGHVLVADTGNKRIVVFDANGEYVSQFGGLGFGPGQFNEPVGVTVDEEGTVFVTDTWNQRVQAFMPAGNGSYDPVREWDIIGWYGQSLDNKPFIAAGNGRVFVSDPEGYRILEFTSQGEFVRAWGDAGGTLDRFRLPTGLALDAEGGVWVVDVGNSRLMRFVIP